MSPGRAPRSLSVPLYFLPQSEITSAPGSGGAAELLLQAGQQRSALSPTEPASLVPNTERVIIHYLSYPRFSALMQRY